MKNNFSSQVVAFSFLGLALLMGCQQVAPGANTAGQDQPKGTPQVVTQSVAYGTWTSNCYTYADNTGVFGTTYAIDSTQFDLLNRGTTSTVYSDARCTQALYSQKLETVYTLLGNGAYLSENLNSISAVSALTSGAAQSLSRGNYCGSNHWQNGTSYAFGTLSTCRLPATRVSRASSTFDGGTKYMLLVMPNGNRVLYHASR
jgi:hypothetical protein